jgi:hypothetical protein
VLAEPAVVLGLTWTAAGGEASWSSPMTAQSGLAIRMATNLPGQLSISGSRSACARCELESLARSAIIGDSVVAASQPRVERLAWCQQDKSCKGRRG